MDERIGNGMAELQTVDTIRVHIVCHEILGKNWVLARMITDNLGWTAGDRPDDYADWDYLFPRQGGVNNMNKIKIHVKTWELKSGLNGQLKFFDDDGEYVGYLKVENGIVTHFEDSLVQQDTESFDLDDDGLIEKLHQFNDKHPGVLSQLVKILFDDNSTNSEDTQ